MQYITTFLIVGLVNSTQFLRQHYLHQVRRYNLSPAKGTLLMFLRCKGTNFICKFKIIKFKIQKFLPLTSYLLHLTSSFFHLPSYIFHLPSFSGTSLS